MFVLTLGYSRKSNSPRAQFQDSGALCLALFMPLLRGRGSGSLDRGRAGSPSLVEGRITVIDHIHFTRPQAATGPHCRQRNGGKREFVRLTLLRSEIGSQVVIDYATLSAVTPPYEDLYFARSALVEPVNLLIAVASKLAGSGALTVPLRISLLVTSLP